MQEQFSTRQNRHFRYPWRFTSPGPGPVGDGIFTVPVVGQMLA